MNSPESTTAPQTHENKDLNVDQEFLLLTGKVAKRYPLPVFFVLAIIGFLAFDTANKAWVIIWIILATIMLFGRIKGIKTIIKNTTLDDKNKIKWICVLNAGNGIFLGLSFLFFPYLSDLEKMLQTVITAGLCAAVVASNVGLKPAILPYLIFTIIPMSAVWIIFPDIREDAWKSYLFSVVVLMYGGILLSIARDYFGFFKNSVEMRSKYSNINTQLEKALDESKASNSAKTRFLATASHDLRQPVHTLSLLMAALMSRKLDAKTENISKNMDLSLQGLAKQLDALLDVSKLDAGIVVPQRSTINLAQTLERLKNQFTPITNEKSLNLIVDYDDTCFISSDSTLLEQIFHNLTSNAIKYTEQGSITIEARLNGDNINVSISDTGIGIAEAEKELVFEEFYQLSNPHRDRTKGLGLGLSIVRRLAHLLDIKIAMNSEPGKGTEFILTLPKSSSHTDETADIFQEDTNFNKILVLVIDDEEDIQVATKIYLEQLNCEVILADDSNSAIEIAKTHKPDLIITDYRLRDNDSGLIAIAGIRQLYADLPTIIITGDTAPDRLREASQVHAKLLHKPIDVDALKLAMQEVLNKEKK